MSEILRYAWLAIYILTLPCIAFHFWIVLLNVVPWKGKRPGRLLEGNLSLAILFHQVITGYFMLAMDYEIWAKEWCGLRRVLKGIPLAVISFTLVKITTERCYVFRNLRRPSLISTLKVVLTINLFSIVIFIPNIFTRHYNINSPKRSKCDQNFLGDSEAWDWTYRLTMLIILCIVPSTFIFQEMRQIKNLIENGNEGDTHGGQKQTLENGGISWERFRIIKSACVFTLLFVCYSLPIGITEAFDSPAITFPQIVRYYQSGIRLTVYMLGYFNTTTFPIYMYYASRDIYR